MKMVIGAFRILRKRAGELGQPGLRVWSDAGERAAAKVASEVSAAAHANECDESDLAQRLEQMAADGKVDAVEFKQLLRMPSRMKRCAERSHEIGEAVQL